MDNWFDKIKKVLKFVISIFFVFPLIECKPQRIDLKTPSHISYKTLNICEQSLLEFFHNSEGSKYSKLQLIFVDSSIVNLKKKEDIDSFLLSTQYDLNKVQLINAVDENEQLDKSIHKYFVVDNTLDLFTKHQATVSFDSLNKCNISNKISLGQLEWHCLVTIKDEIETKFSQKFNTLEPIIIDKSVFRKSQTLTISLQFDIKTIFYKVNIL
jgi:hypothetical protein